MKNNNFFTPIILFIIIILILVAGYFGFKQFLTPQTFCWPYCPGITDQDREAMKKAGSEADIANLPTTCKDEQGGTPVITSLSSYSGSVGTKLEINGCNFAGFEGDKNAWIHNEKGEKGILYGEAGSSSKLLKVTLKSPLCQKDTSYSGLSCDSFLTLTPGYYRIFVIPWSKVSNTVSFIIK